jgi:hypothetical protein
MSKVPNAQMLRLIAARIELSERVVVAADLLMHHLGGFLARNGETLDTSQASTVPEVVELRAALKAWDEGQPA